mmetsp:Transcript_22555/g.56960  ORF Transcript_22555/g.56960 Transcript_22555/m.56960 type:complete len:233 (+) Transcript_22555:314-1012(+)
MSGGAACSRNQARARHVGGPPGVLRGDLRRRRHRPAGGGRVCGHVAGRCPPRALLGHVLCPRAGRRRSRSPAPARRRGQAPRRHHDERAELAGAQRIAAEPRADAGRHRRRGDQHLVLRRPGGVRAGLQVGGGGDAHARGRLPAEGDEDAGGREHQPWPPLAQGLHRSPRGEAVCPLPELAPHHDAVLGTGGELPHVRGGDGEQRESARHRDHAVAALRGGVLTRHKRQLAG